MRRYARRPWIIGIVPALSLMAFTWNRPAFAEVPAAPGAGSNASAARFVPDAATVERHGAGYRYPQAGWIVLHIEGAPYERGFQHGRLMAPEIARFIPELARYRGARAPAEAWNDLRMVADALFARKFDPEQREEMKGIADGAAEAGAAFDGRPIDYLDIVTINADVETNFLEGALEATPNGLEGKRFSSPPARPPGEGHCSAFAATGPATVNGQVVIGHITMWNLFHAYHYNVWLDVRPTKGHRVLMQTFPGSIMSGMDYYMNDDGIVVCETTIRPTSFAPEGAALCGRIRRALQYGSSIDDVVRILKQDNNGLYANEWIMADVKTGEIAMFDLGTKKSRLWRGGPDGRGDWFGGTTGFYWACNNAKDLDVRLETIPSTSGRPANLVFHPADRDRAWLRLFDGYKPAIDVNFGFKAFATPPLAASHSLDAKFTTTAMARELATWARFGPPLGAAWAPTDTERARYPGIHALVPNDWTVLRADRPKPEASPMKPAADLARVPRRSSAGGASLGRRAPLWRGTILPRADVDAWLAAAFAEAGPIVALEREHQNLGRFKRMSLTAPPTRARERFELARFAPISTYLSAVARRGGRDIALKNLESDLRSDEWYDIAAGKGVLVLLALKDVMGEQAFLTFMDDFGRAHAGAVVGSDEFFQAAAKAHGKPLNEAAGRWLGDDALSSLGDEARRRQASRRFWSVTSFERQLDHTIIVYGTLAEADAQREAAERLQTKLAARWANVRVPIKADVDASDPALKGAHVLLVGRPSTNRLAARLAGSLPVRFGPSSFAFDGRTYAHPLTSIVAAGPNPLAADRSVVVFAGLSAEGTWDCVGRFPDRDAVVAEALLNEARGPSRRLVVQGTPPAPSTVSAANGANAGRAGAPR